MHVSYVIFVYDFGEKITSKPLQPPFPLLATFKKTLWPLGPVVSAVAAMLCFTVWQI